MEDKYIHLVEAAKKASLFSYSPYSKFRVGAALLTKSGKIYSGCNIENRSYGPTVCAERVAIFKAISEGDREFEAIAVYGADCSYPLPPCGVCRQVISEFSKNAVVIMSDSTTKSIVITSIDKLLPMDSLEDLVNRL